MHTHIQGAVATAGQVVDWLMDQMQFVSSIEEIGKYVHAVMLITETASAMSSKICMSMVT